MNKIVTHVDIASEKPFSVIHIADTHLTLCDKRDNERKQELAKQRSKRFEQAYLKLSQVVSFANEHELFVLHGGDLIDFVSYANLDAAKKFFESTNSLIAAGNHEFSLYVGEEFEDEAYRNRSLPLVQQYYKSNLRFDSVKINGVNFVALDNSYYRIDRQQLSALKSEAALGMPIVLLLHTPLYSRELYDEMILKRKETDAGLMSVPSKLMENYSDYHLRQQAEDETTHEAFEYIKAQPLIKDVLAGHLHFDFETSVTDSLSQYVTGTETVRVLQIG